MPLQADRYVVSEQERTRFQQDGYVHLPALLTPAEVAEIEATYMRFMRREIDVKGRDFCDMSGDYERSLDEFAILNIMLPRRYYPTWQGNVFERRAAGVAAQLHGPDMVIDYDQLLAKRPDRPDALFHWHQDQAYWIETPDQRTATFWLAIDDSTLANGCMRFVVGSNREQNLRPHQPLHGDRKKSHTLVAEVDEARDAIRPVPIRRGDVTVHDERVIHGSSGNLSTGWRRAYILAFRSAATVSEERRRGFTHSHNDNLEVLNQVGIAGQSR